MEPSLGADRVALAFLCEAYDEEVVDAGKNDTRVVMRLHPALAPFKACLLYTSFPFTSITMVIPFPTGPEHAAFTAPAPDIRRLFPDASGP